jgi:photosystem II stability/assembly factor-like uncharacterized protein
VEVGIPNVKISSKSKIQNWKLFYALAIILSLMKNIKTLFFALASISFLTGCSLTSGGNDGGMYRSDDGGKTFSLKSSINQNGKVGSISGVDVLSIAVNPQNGDEVYIGTKASGILKTTNAGENWQSLKVSQLTPEKVYSLVIDQNDPKIVYAPVVEGKRGMILKSEDAGANWKVAYTEPEDGSLVLCLALDPQNSQNIYAGTDKGQIFFSENGGETWRSLYWPENKQAIYKIAIDRSNSQIVYFAIFENGMLRTKDGGKTFEQLGNNMSFAERKLLQNPTALIADPYRPEWVYVGTSEGLLRSKNAGDSWETTRTLNKSQEDAIRSIAINPQNSEEIIYAVSKAFYKSNDGGVNWSTVQFTSSRSLEVVAYNQNRPEMIYAGLNKR